MGIDTHIPKVRDITVRFTVTEGVEAPDIGVLIEPWPDFLVGVQVLQEDEPRNATSEEAESMCWLEDTDASTA